MIKKLKLNQDNQYDYYFLKTTEQECNEIKTIINAFKNTKDIDIRDNLNSTLYSKFSINVENILELGDTKVSASWANKHIEHVVAKYDGVFRSTPILAYKCFANISWKQRVLQNNLIVHEDGLSSWNCAMDILNHPTHGIVYKTSHKDTE